VKDKLAFTFSKVGGALLHFYDNAEDGSATKSQCSANLLTYLRGIRELRSPAGFYSELGMETFCFGGLYPNFFIDFEILPFGK
jgi:hypothetical protein